MSDTQYGSHTDHALVPEEWFRDATIQSYNSSSTFKFKFKG